MASFHVRLTEVVEKYEYYDFDFTEEELVDLKDWLKYDDASEETIKLIDSLTLDIVMAILDNDEYPEAYEEFEGDIKTYVEDIAYEQDYKDDYGDLLDREWRFTKNEN